MIAVTSARDADVVRHAVAQGVVLYLLKPFTFATFRAKLEQYAAYRAQLGGHAPTRSARTTSTGCSARCGTLRPRPAQGDERRDAARGHAALRAAGPALSATEAAEVVGASRVTARRYLEHLADAGQVERQPRYGGSGRPEVEYRWRADPARDRPPLRTRMPPAPASLPFDKSPAYPGVMLR